jgi:uncharacterized protein
MSAPDYDGAIAFALNRLRNELAPELLYHSIWHTEHEVMPAAILFARACGVSDEDQRLVEVAAAYHDIGMIETRVEHEQRGAAIAAVALPDYGFDQQVIERIKGMIMATRLPQSPTNLLEQILADADLDVLGREDFLERNSLLRQELAIMGKVVSDEEWFTSQQAFLQRHVYFTPAAHQLREEGRRANLVRFAKHFGYRH